MKRPLIISLLCTLLLPLYAQQAIHLTGEKSGQDTQAEVANVNVVKTAGRTVVTMDFIFDQMDVPSNRYRAFTPIIRSANNEQEQRLKTVIVSGRRQNIVFERDGIDALYAPTAGTEPVIIARQKGQPQQYAYTDAVDDQPWFSGASLFIESDLCGCGDKMKNDETFITHMLPPDPWDLVELINKEPDTYKPARELHGTAYITFVVDRWEMKPDYMDNRRELRKITDTLDIMVADKNITVNTIKIHGFASPESPYNHNHMLATNRAKSLTDWLRQNYQLPASAFAPAEATPENWMGLSEAIKELAATPAIIAPAALTHKEDIAAIVNDLLSKDSLTIARTADATEASIKRRYPQDYQYLLKNVYPGLRRSDYEITFNIRQFNTIEECLDIYRTKPHQLSKHELWRVAQTMQPFSDDYNRAMQTALNFYPDDEVVNLNLANVALAQHDILKAQTLLEHAGTSAEADNARAVIAIVQQRYAEAEQLLNAAQQKGLNVARNREALATLTQLAPQQP
jgi:hypothetical protein